MSHHERKYDVHKGVSRNDEQMIGGRKENRMNSRERRRKGGFTVTFQQAPHRFCRKCVHCLQVMLSKKSKLIGDFRLTSCSPEGLENDQSKSTSSHSSIYCFVLAPIIFPDYIILFCDNRIALNFRFRF